MIEAEFYTSNGTHWCPFCGCSTFRYRTIERSEWHYEMPDSSHIEHFGPVRDCECKNCSGTWLMEIDP